MARSPKLRSAEYGEAFGTAARAMREAGISTPELDARLLLCHSAGITHEAMIANRETHLAQDIAERFTALIERRMAGEPVSRIVGEREFYGRPFRIDASTLDPRPDTETLIEAALDFAEEKGWLDAPIRILDLGTGSGAILLTLLAELPRATGVGVDLSEPALAVARANAAALGVGGRALFIASDWFADVEGTFDLIVSNPPYIPTAEIAGLGVEVRDHDPHGALDGGTDGLAAYRAIAGKLAAFLRLEGVFLAEIGSDQARSVRGVLREAGLLEDGDGLWRDLAGRPRVVAAHAASWQRPLCNGSTEEKRDLEKACDHASFMATK